MADLQQIVDLLLKTTQNNTQVIRKAQRNLQQLGKSPKFITTLLSITQIQGISKNVARIATIYTLTYARNLVAWQNQAFINIAAEQLLNYICTDSIDYKYRDQVGAALQYFILKDFNNIIANAYMSNLITIFRNQLKKPPKQIGYQYISIICDALSDKAVPGTGANVQNYLYEQFLALPVFVKNLLEMANQYINVDDSMLQKLLIIATKFLKIIKKGLKKFAYFSTKLTQTLYMPQYEESINISLNFNLPQNKIKVPIFYQNPNISNSKIIQCFHIIKSITIYNIAQTIRIISSVGLKVPQIVQQNSKLFTQCPIFIKAFVEGVDSLLTYTPCHKINSKLKFKIIEEVFNFLILCLRVSKFYTTFFELKNLILYSCIFKTLALNQKDYENYYHDPEQFANSLFHIIQINSAYLLGNDKPQMNDEQIQIQIFDTLKTNAANLLKVFVKYIDGTLPQLMYYMTNIIEDRLNVQFSKILMLFTLCILKDEVKSRNQYLYEIKKIVFRNLQQLQIPKRNVEEPYNVQYCMNLLILTLYLLLFDELVDQINTIDRTFDIVEKLLRNDKVEEVAKIFASQAILKMIQSEQGGMYCKKTIQILNQIMSVKKLNLRYLKCIQNIIKQYDFNFKSDYLVLIQMVEKVSAFLQSEIKKPQKNKEIINMLWHILQEIVASQNLVIPMSETMKRIIQPLINMIDGNNQQELQEKVYMLIQMILKSTGEVTQYELQVFGVIPKTFYTGQNKMRMSTSFSLIQSIIQQGKQILSSNLIMIKSLILFSVENITALTVNQKHRPETDCLDGIFTIQSLVITLGNVFNQQIWLMITKALTQRILTTNIVYGFVKQSIISTLTVILSIAYNSFSPSDNQELINLILKQFHHFAHRQPTKLFVISASNLLQNYKQQFIRRRFVQLLDYIVTLLKYTLVNKASKKESNDLEYQFKQFQTLCEQVKNCYTGIDQYSYFKSIIQSIKESDSNLLEMAYRELPETKQVYLKQMMSMKKVNNNARIIYRLKNKGQNQGMNLQLRQQMQQNESEM